jgi:hypothetical protein
VLTDDELLDFDASRLASPPDARRLLAEHGDVYRAQLVAARWIEGWRERMEADPLVPPSPDYAEGHAEALRELAANLRQGDLLPGGTLYEFEVNGRRRG